jgi:hypothetical protein
VPSGPPQRIVTHLRKHAGQHSKQLYAELPQIVGDLIRVIGTVRLAEPPLQNQDDHFRLLVEVSQGLRHLHPRSRVKSVA